MLSSWRVTSRLGGSIHARALSTRLNLPATNFVPIEGMHLVPEGYAGDMNEDIEITGQNRWMIRDCARVVCNIIDDFPVKNKGEKNQQVVGTSISGEWRSLNLEGFSDRPEWRTCEMNGQIYGADVLERPKSKGKLKDDALANATGEQGIKTSSDFMTALKKKSNGKLPDKVLLTGQRGSGKSTVLTQAVAHARSNGWLCLFVPNGWDHVQSGTYVEPLRGKKGVYDNPLMSVSLLRDFYTAHRKHLEGIPLSSSAVFGKYQKFLKNFTDGWHRAQQVKGREGLDFIKMRELITEEDFPQEDMLDEEILSDFEFLEREYTSLADLVLFGIAFRENAGLVFMDLIDELKGVESMPVLIAVDQYNSWEGSSAFAYRDEVVQGRQLCVPNALQFISRRKSETEAWKMRNGMCIAAVSSKHPAEGGLAVYRDIANSIPLTLHVPAFSKQEYVSVLSHYAQTKVIDLELTRADIATFRTITGSLGREIRKEFTSYFFPMESNTVLKDMERLEVKYAVYGEEGEPEQSLGRTVSQDSVEGIVNSMQKQKM